MADPLVTAAAQAKSAAGTESEFAQRQLRSLLRLAALAAATGAGARGGAGLYNLARRNISPLRTEPASVTVPWPRSALGDDEKRADAGRSVYDSSWYMPAAILTGGAGLFGGWKALDAILDRRRRAEQEDEMEQAQGAFESALRARVGKAASDGELIGERLDQVFDAAIKTAGAWDKTKAGLLTWLMLGTLLPGYASYKHFAGRQRRRVLEDAIDRRRRQTAAAAPLPLQPVLSDGEDDDMQVPDLRLTAA